VANLPEILACRYVRDESFFQSKFKTSKQNRRLARFGLQAVFWFRLPPWYLVYPLARLIYPMIPVSLKKRVRKANGLQENSN
ncbi:MAG: hypothetical protein V7782_10970, partial [Psychromonas sp.]